MLVQVLNCIFYTSEKKNGEWAAEIERDDEK